MVVDLDSLSRTFVDLGRLLLVGAAVYAAVLLVGEVTALLLRRAAARLPQHAPMLGLLARVARVVAIGAGALAALENSGINVTAFVASLGIAGLTIGFALRDIASSAVAGMLIIAFRPFGPGDHVTVLGVQGKVRTIDLRYIVLVDGERTHLVPNSVLLTNPVTVQKI